MIDLHCHVLPGIDDGPQTVEESLELARAAQADGTTVLAATPHVDWRHSEVRVAAVAAAWRPCSRCSTPRASTCASWPARRSPSTARST